jgi:hypothetical protein
LGVPTGAKANPPTESPPENPRDERRGILLLRAGRLKGEIGETIRLRLGGVNMALKTVVEIVVIIIVISLAVRFFMKRG